jgi:hypothetical protein
LILKKVAVTVLLISSQVHSTDSVTASVVVCNMEPTGLLGTFRGVELIQNLNLPLVRIEALIFP